MKSRLLSVVVIVLALATACGGDSAPVVADDAPTTERGQSLARRFQATGTAPATLDEANCLGRRMVAELDRTTVDNILRDIDMALIGSDAEQTRLAVGIFLDCVDMQRWMTATALAEGNDQEASECFATSLTDDDYQTFMLELSDGDMSAGLLATLMRVERDCGTNLFS